MRYNFLQVILLTFIFLVSLISKAQEHPPIINYTPKEYGAENQNWNISQSLDKKIYSGNNDGLLEFNGEKWKLYPSPNQTIIRAVRAVNDRIYVGAYMEFGYWKKNDFGNLEYNSLSEKLKEKLIEDEHFWNIEKFDDWILFQSLNRIYIFDSVNETFRIINSETLLHRVFKVQNNIYFQKLNDGFYKIENGIEVLISSDPVISKNKITNVYVQNGDLLLITQDFGFFKLRNKKLSKWKIKSNAIVSGLSVYSSIQLKNGDFILGTISNGIYQLSSDGNVISKINQTDGLNNNTVLSLFEDIDGNVWLGLDNGISVINLNSPLRIYNDIYGELGTVYTTSLFNDILYLGTNQGLFYKMADSNNDFTFIEGTKGQVWSLEVLDGKLFCGHDLGTFIVHNNSVNLIANIPGTWDFENVSKNKNLIIQGNYDGVYVLEKKGDNWVLRNKIDGFENISSMHIFLNDKNQLFVSHEYKGIYKLKINDDFTKITSFEIDKSAPKSFKSSLVNYNNQLIYASESGIFKYNNVKEKFEKDTLFTNSFLENDKYISGKFIVDDYTNTLWGFTEKNIKYFSPGKLTNELKVNKIPLPYSIRKSVAGYESTTFLNNQRYLFGTSTGYIILNLAKVQSEIFSIEINSIEKSILGTEKMNVSLKESGEFSSDENNLFFSFSVPGFNKYSSITYQYRLAGIYDDWRILSSNSTVSFENLPYGNYSFQVRGKNVDKYSDNIATYNFTINRPWYLTNSMLSIYTAVFILILYITNYIYKRRFNKQKLKLIDKKHREFELSQLENEKVIMKLKNDKLEHEVESKTRELSTSTMSIIKKNELLNTIKKELVGINEIEEVKPVIKIINKSLINNNDWEMFEEAFNSADSDFLKKLKLIHASLTPNDLRLCAYLRLNLSSKEIAPLLNISPRSVEIKRYRLRKKIELPHEKGLVEYILEL